MKTCDVKLIFGLAFLVGVLLYATNGLQFSQGDCKGVVVDKYATVGHGFFGNVTQSTRFYLSIKRDDGKVVERFVDRQGWENTEVGEYVTFGYYD